MPVLVRNGNQALFVVELLDATGAVTTGFPATLQVSYTNIAGTPQTDTLVLKPYGRRYTATWDSTPAKVGAAQYAVSWAGGSIAITDPNLRITAP
jgi:hypothetical protein